MNDIFYRNIESYCRAKNITIKAFAEACGFDASTVARWKKGASPTLRMLYAIQEHTQIPIQQWVDGGAA